MRDWMDTALFGPLGMDTVFEFDAAGTLLGGSSAYMSARDYARFGLLLLRDGMWEGERMLPPGWVDFNRTAPADTDMNIYGAGFWLAQPTSDNPELTFLPPYDSFHAGGREGQLVWIVPSRDLVIVRAGLMPDSPDTWGALYDFAQQVAQVFED
ncbi:MAG: serine hydrolase, partial [Litorimonas sp.]